MKIFSRPPAGRPSKVKDVLKTITADPTPVNQVIEEHKVKLGSLKQGASRYPTPPGRVRFGYLEDGTHVIYRDMSDVVPT